MINGIAFDWGGIFTQGTFDSDAIRNLASLTGLSQEKVSAVYLPLMEPFEAGAFSFDSYIEQLQEGLGTVVPAADLKETFLNSGVERAEMFTVLKGIPDTYRVGVLSNNVDLLCDRVRDDPRMDRVESWTFSNEIKVRKPDAAAYQALVDAMGLPAGEIVFIDDNAMNVEAAREFGLQAIHLTDMAGFRMQWADLDLP